METIGQRVSKLRELAGVSSRELSLIVGLSPNALGALERDVVTDAKSRIALRLSKALGVDLVWLVSGVGTKPVPEAVRAAIESARSTRALPKSA